MKRISTIVISLIALAISPPANAEYIDIRHYSILGVTLDERGVDSVTPILGTPRFIKGISGDAACYVGPDNTVIVFEKTMMGYGYTVYSPERSSAVIEKYDCLEATALTREISNGARLALGMSPRGVKELLGPPKDSQHKKYTYEYSARLKMTKEESDNFLLSYSPEERTKDLMEQLYWDIFSSIEIDFNDRCVAQFSVFTSITH